MKERGILFSAPMVCALLDGTKTQTRRAMKPQPQLESDGLLWWRFSKYTATASHVAPGKPSDSWLERCPYGMRGDRLWVRETFAIESTRDYEGDIGIAPPLGPVKWEDDGSYRSIPRYRASEPDTALMIAPSEKDDIGMRWTPSIFMPRWASRITLEITEVRVERLQDISQADAEAEGLTYQNGLYATPGEVWQIDPRKAYRDLWEQINGPGSWAANPWVWAVSFRRHTTDLTRGGGDD